MPKFAAVALYCSLPLRNLVDFSFCNQRVLCRPNTFSGSAHP
jgi:hypothetical protein